jgi:hypothetical protein
VIKFDSKPMTAADRRLLMAMTANHEANQMISAARADELKAKHPDFADKIDELAKRDPTPQKKYLGWAVQRVVDGDDLEEVADTVDEFHVDSHRLAKKDIFAYKTLKELTDALDEVSKDRGGVSEKQFRTSVGHTSKASKKLVKTKDADYLYHSKNLLLVFPRTKTASCHFGFGTGWCISIKEADYWERYRREDNSIFYFIIDKNKSSEGVARPEKLKPGLKLNDPWAKVSLQVNRIEKEKESEGPGAVPHISDVIAWPLDDNSRNLGQVIMHFKKLYGKEIHDIIEIMMEHAYKQPDNTEFFLKRLQSIRDPDEIRKAYEKYKSLKGAQDIFAKLKHAPYDVLKDIAERSDSSGKISLLNNGQADFTEENDLGAILAKDSDVEVRKAVVSAINQKLRSLWGDEQKKVAIESPKMAEAIAALIADVDDVRMEMAGLDALPETALVTLAKDSNPKVRGKVASRSDLPVSVSQALKEDTDPEVQAVLLKNTSDLGVLSKALDSESEAMRQAAAERILDIPRNTTEEQVNLLVKIAKDQSEQVVKELAKLTRVPDQVFTELRRRNDQSPIPIFAVIATIAATNEDHELFPLSADSLAAIIPVLSATSDKVLMYLANRKNADDRIYKPLLRGIIDGTVDASSSLRRKVIHSVTLDQETFPLVKRIFTDNINRVGEYTGYKAGYVDSLLDNKTITPAQIQEAYAIVAPVAKAAGYGYSDFVRPFETNSKTPSEVLRDIFQYSRQTSNARTQLLSNPNFPEEDITSAIQEELAKDNPSVNAIMALLKYPKVSQEQLLEIATAFRPAGVITKSELLKEIASNKSASADTLGEIYSQIAPFTGSGNEAWYKRQILSSILDNPNLSEEVYNSALNAIINDPNISSYTREDLPALVRNPRTTADTIRTLYSAGLSYGIRKSLSLNKNTPSEILVEEIKKEIAGRRRTSSTDTLQKLFEHPNTPVNLVVDYAKPKNAVGEAARAALANRPDKPPPAKRGRKPKAAQPVEPAAEQAAPVAPVVGVEASFIKEAVSELADLFHLLPVSAFAVLAMEEAALLLEE